MKKIDASEGTDVNKKVCQKNANFVIIGFLKMLDLNINHTLVMDVINY